MELKPRLKNQLKMARHFSEELLSSFHTPQQWTHQVHPDANHALWFAGHMGVVDNFMISLIAPDKSSAKPRFQELFGMGSRPTANADAYPPIDEVRAYMTERRETLLGILDELDDDGLSRPLPEGAPDFLKDVASTFSLVAWHEGLHSGQVSVARRALGNAPLHG